MVLCAHVSRNVRNVSDACAKRVKKPICPRITLRFKPDLNKTSEFDLTVLSCRVEWTIGIKAIHLRDLIVFNRKYIQP